MISDAQADVLMTFAYKNRQVRIVSILQEKVVLAFASNDGHTYKHLFFLTLDQAMTVVSKEDWEFNTDNERLFQYPTSQGRMLHDILVMGIDFDNGCGYTDLTGQRNKRRRNHVRTEDDRPSGDELITTRKTAKSESYIYNQSVKGKQHQLFSHKDKNLVRLARDICWQRMFIDSSPDEKSVNGWRNWLASEMVLHTMKPSELKKIKMMQDQVNTVQNNKTPDEEIKAAVSEDLQDIFSGKNEEPEEADVQYEEEDQEEEPPKPEEKEEPEWYKERLRKLAEFKKTVEGKELEYLVTCTCGCLGKYEIRKSVGYPDFDGEKCPSGTEGRFVHAFKDVNDIMRVKVIS